MLYDWSMESNYITGKWRCISQSEMRNSAAAGSGGGQKIPPPQPPSFLPARAFGLAREARRQFRSKKFRAKFRISHQSQLSPFWERIASRLRRSAFGPCALRETIKSPRGATENGKGL